MNSKYTQIIPNLPPNLATIIYNLVFDGSLWNGASMTRCSMKCEWKEMVSR